jgi:hypothetical protein
MTWQFKRQIFGRHPNDFVFPGIQGHPFSEVWFQSKVLRPALVAAELPTRIRPRTLQLTGAALLLEAGASVPFVAHQLGEPVGKLRARVGPLIQPAAGGVGVLEAVYASVAGQSRDQDLFRSADAMRARLDTVTSMPTVARDTGREPP